MKPFTLTIDGRRWRVVEGDPGRNRLGLCDYESRIVTVRKGGTTLERVGVVSHEMIHAALPDMIEDAVLRTERAIVTALHKAGLLTEDD